MDSRYNMAGYSLEHGHAYPAGPSYEGQYTAYPTAGYALPLGFGPLPQLPSPPPPSAGPPFFVGYGQYAFPQPWAHPQPTPPELVQQVGLPPFQAAPHPPTADNNPPAITKRGRGRPPGAKNKDKNAEQPPAKQRGRPKGALDSRPRTGYKFKDPEKEKKRRARKPAQRQQEPSPPTSHADIASSSHADDSDLALDQTSMPSALTSPVIDNFLVAAPASTAGVSAHHGDEYTGPGSRWTAITPPVETGVAALDPDDMFGYQDIDGNDAGLFEFGGMF